jgi:hypothetical protein
MTKTRLLRPLAAVGTGLALAIGGVAVIAGPASADTPGCVTRAEFDRVHKGMTKKRVHRIFDFHGIFHDGHAGGYTRAYSRCDHEHMALVTYRKTRHKPARVAEKRWTFRH